MLRGHESLGHLGRHCGFKDPTSSPTFTYWSKVLFTAGHGREILPGFVCSHPRSDANQDARRHYHVRLCQGVKDTGPTYNEIPCIAHAKPSPATSANQSAALSTASSMSSTASSLLKLLPRSSERQVWKSIASLSVATRRLLPLARTSQPSASSSRF